MTRGGMLGAITITVALAAAAFAWLRAPASQVATASSAAAPPAPVAPSPLAVPAVPSTATAPATPGRTPPRPAATLPAPLQGLAESVLQALDQGPTARGCEQAQEPVLELLRQSAIDSPAWRWAMDRARDCLRALTPFRASNGLLAALIERYPDHPRVKELAGLQQYDAGDLRAAANTLGEAVEEEDDDASFEAWEAYADAQLALARDLRDRGDPAWQDALARAEAAAFRALQLAGDETRPFALHTVARTQLELGRPAEATEWANRAVEAVRAGGSRYQAVMVAELYVFAGQIYYRAGHRDAGLAYMDQGIAMAASAEQQAGLRYIRDQFLRMYGTA